MSVEGLGGRDALGHGELGGDVRRGRRGEGDGGDESASG